jgi:hypothetical protein
VWRRIDGWHTKQTGERQRRRELNRRVQENGEGSAKPYSWKH